MSLVLLNNLDIKKGRIIYKNKVCIITKNPMNSFRTKNKTKGMYIKENRYEINNAIKELLISPL